jgi:hypothetical protein
MRRPSFNDMAKSPSILSAERSPAATVAITVLCLLGVVQLGTLAKTAWEKFVPAPPVAAVKAAPPLPVVPTPALSVSSGLPPLPDLGKTSLPPLPALPGASGLPPLPTPTATPAPVSVPTPQPLASASLPPPMPAPAAVSLPQAPPKASAPRSQTGNPQVDELIDVAIDSRALEDMAGALQALERAELLLPDHPAVLREKALTLGRMGQQAQAQALWDRAKSMAGSAAPPVTAPSAPSPSAMTTGSQGPLTLGTCRVEPDPAATNGQRLVVKVPVRSQPGVTIDPAAMNLDVFFYDRVDGSRVENTKADTPVFSFDMPVDFASGEEVISVVYHMPKLSPQEEAEIGRREFYGFVVKLYCQQKLVSTTAEPRGLLTQSATAAGTPLPAAP